METSFPNLYFGLNLCQFGSDTVDMVKTIRSGEIPTFTVTQAINFHNGFAAINTPPPHKLTEIVPSTPMPKGSPFVGFVRLRNMVKTELADEKKEIKIEAQ